MEDDFYWMDLDPSNVGDLMLDISVTLSANLMAGVEHLHVGTLIGIVSEEDGGIIAYAIGEDHAEQITKALRKAGKDK